MELSPRVWDPLANITQDHGLRCLRPHPSQKPAAEPGGDRALGAVFACGPLWGAVSCRLGHLGWPGSPGASPPAALAWSPLSQAARAPRASQRAQVRRAAGCAPRRCPPGRGWRTSLRPGLSATTCFLTRGTGGDCAPSDSVGTGERRPHAAPGLAHLPADTPGAQGTPRQC